MPDISNTNLGSWKGGTDTQGGDFAGGEELFRSAWERSIDGMRLTDRSGRIVAVNEAYCQLIKLPREQLLGRVFSVSYAGHGPHDGIDLYQRRFDTGAIVPRFQAQVHLWNHEVLDLEISNSFVEAPGNGKLVLSIFRDISERRQAEQRSETFSNLGYRLSSAKTPREAAEVIVQVADYLLGWDACFLQLYSASENKVRSVLAMDIVNGRRDECALPSNNSTPGPLTFKTIREGGQLILRQPEELDSCSPPGFGDKARRAASLLFVPIRNENECLGVLSVQSYGTHSYDQQSLETLQALADHCAAALERLKTEEKLHCAQNRLNHLVTQSPAVIYSLQMGPSQAAFTWVSDNIARILGYSAAEAVEPNWLLQCIHPEDRGSLLVGFTELLTLRQMTRDYRIRHKAGAYRWIRDEQRLLEAGNDRPAEIVGSLTDITDRKELEHQLRHAQKMEAIGLLAGGVAHDFNNLLAVIRGNCELVLMGDSAPGGIQQECLKQVVDASDRAANLTRQLLAFSRKQLLRSQPLNLNDVIANLSKMLNRVIGENVELECRLAPQISAVDGDVGMLEQVMVNLVVNSRDAMAHGGKITIRTGDITVDEARARSNPQARPGQFVYISVTDSGCGIAAENLSRIFEPFFTTKELGKGTGLGLAMVYGIVQQHKGWIEVESVVDKGSTFRILLPVTHQLVRPTGRQSTGGTLPGGTEKILLVEDDDSVRALTRRCLQSLGYQVVEARSGKAALRTWKESGGEMDLLLTDIIMPDGMNGMELAQNLSTDRPTLKVIFMSGYSGDALPGNTQFIRAQHSRFLQKPCSWAELARTLHEMLHEDSTVPVSSPATSLVE